MTYQIVMITVTPLIPFFIYLYTPTKCVDDSPSYTTI